MIDLRRKKNIFMRSISPHAYRFKDIEDYLKSKEKIMPTTSIQVANLYEGIYNAAFLEFEKAIVFNYREKGFGEISDLENSLKIPLTGVNFEKLNIEKPIKNGTWLHKPNFIYTPSTKFLDLKDYSEFNS